MNVDNIVKIITKSLYPLQKKHILSIIKDWNGDVKDIDFYKKLYKKKQNIKQNKNIKNGGNDTSKSYLITRAKRHSSKIKQVLDNSDANIKNKIKLLDIGAGDCSITIELGKLMGFKKAIGLDIEQGIYDEYFDECNYQVYDGETIPFADNSFDMITCLMTLHHIEKLDKVLDEIHRVLKMDGVLLIREHDKNSDETEKLIEMQHILFYMLETKGDMRKLEAYLKNPTGNYMSKKELFYKMKKKNFKNIKYENKHMKFDCVRAYFSIWKSNIS